MADIKYPEQIYKCARTDKTLGIDAKLFAADTKGGQSPLEMHSGFSRFVFTILANKGGSYDFVTANLPPSELALMRKKSDIAVEKLTAKALEKKPTLSAAYTTTFFTGTFKGKTPADVLMEDATKEEALLEYKKTLEANLAKYPRNKVQMDAIDEAIKLQKSGDLKPDGIMSQTMDIYRADIRAPHASKKDAEGYTDVYSFSVVCDLSKNYPFAVNIMNCKATMTVNPNGTQTPNMSKTRDKKEFNILLTESEWYKAISRMEKTSNLFEESIFADMLKIATENSFHAKTSK